MKLRWSIRIILGLVVISYIYNHALSLPPGSEIYLSTSGSLNAPSNVRLEELEGTNDGVHLFVLHVDQSIKWLAISIMGGILTVVLLSLPEKITKPKSFIDDELDLDVGKKKPNKAEEPTPNPPCD